MAYSFADEYARNLAEQIRHTARDREYARWALEARKQYVDLRLRQDPEIRKVYLEAARRAGELLGVRNRWPSDVVLRRRLRHLQTELEEVAKAFNDEYTAKLKVHIAKAVEAGTGYSRAIVVSLVKQATWDVGPVVALFAQVNQQAVEACWARTKNGLFLSDRIWQQGQNVRDAMKEIIETGVATGMDAKDLARALEGYVKDGAKTLARQYPNMMKRLKGRIPANLTYEGLRLARTEVTAAFGEGAVSAARVSPSYKGMRWILSSAHPLPDVCNDLAERDDFGLGPGVYAPGNEPMYPAHPNCLCVLVPVHETPEEFVQRLRRWQANPATEPGLEGWYRSVYAGQRKEVTPIPLRFPASLGARIDPDQIKARYKPEQVLEVIRASSWESSRALKAEYADHRGDWVKELGRALELKEFEDLQEALLGDSRAAVYYYVHRQAGEELAVYIDRIHCKSREPLFTSNF